MERVRSQRLLLSVLNGAADAASEISAELHGCAQCTARLAGLYLTYLGTAFVHMSGGDLDKATEAVQQSILVDLDAGPGHG